MTKKCDRTLHPGDPSNFETCPNFATHEAYVLGGGGQVFLCQEHAADPQAEGWYLEAPQPLTEYIEHLKKLLDEAHAQLVYIHKDQPEGRWPIFSVRAPGPLYLVCKSDGPLEWSIHKDPLAWHERRPAEEAAAAAPKWWGSQAYFELEAIKSRKAAAAEKGEMP